jgi:hypothetical protein
MPKLPLRRNLRDAYCFPGFVPGMILLAVYETAIVGTLHPRMVTGARESAKIFGCVEVYDATFIYDSHEVFNGSTYVDFLEGKMAPGFYRRGRKVIYIHDNASYHKEQAVQEWFHAHRNWLEVQPLPAYSPEFNAAEPFPCRSSSSCRWKQT